MALSSHVFISFASHDEELARRVVDQLERSGLRCWISDRDIEPSASYPAAITAAVKTSGAFLLLLTPSANQSPHVLRETELAFNNRIPILPLRIDAATPTADLQYFLSTSQWSDAGSTFDDADVAAVQPVLRTLLDRGSQGRRREFGDTRPRARWFVVAGLLSAAVIALALLLLNARRENGPPEVGPVPAATPLPAPITQPPAAAARTNAKVNARDGQMYAWVPPGRYTMGCSAGDPACADDEKPAHVVAIRRGFWLAQTEVTAAQYRKSAGSASDVQTEPGIPATRVAWSEAKQYCAAIGGRLPSEAEWEYAARAGTTERAYGPLSEIAWFEDDSDGHPHPVGMKAANDFGLYDMLGNVSEWVRDRYYNAYDDSTDASEVVEPTAGNASAVARGGSFLSEASGVRVSRRLEMEPDAREPHIGFRCALDQL